ncbi:MULTISPECIES: sensor histidine kinase [unclassified Arthrobacter]|uniref:sensor histidine kinase n=1 Tax=unclassified Arthrobacter TaxID=235627 RepID=UPI001492331A|nr:MULTISPECIES: histidine kinase [unclassified Arthrobacter]MBE0010304.1 sensor histidine kinase [Arthrobacter sp. AET 35A]NOJ64239.1 sensor histidine kinase [Arthrobacter sp. 147(2020)]
MDLHHRLARVLRAHPGRVDFVIMAVLFLLLVTPTLISAFRPIEMVAAVGLVLPLAWRRSQPVLAAGLIAAVSVLQIIFYVWPQPGQVAVLIALYALAAYAPRWASLGGLAVASVGCFAGLVRYSAEFGISPFEMRDASLPLFVVIAVLVQALVLLCWAFGDLARNRRLTLRALEDRARRLEVERQQERDLAAADERSHIAREMHDIVAHSLSVIITQADGARYASAQNAAVAPATLATIAETGRASLREMRRLLGVLRGDEEASTRPLPVLTDIPTLIETVQRAGLTTSYTVKGTSRRELPAGAELTAYRVVQESLTNVLKHAGPDARAVVEQAWTPRGLSLTIDDDGRGAGADPLSVGAEQGIKGMRERVRLYDGNLAAGAQTGGGYRIEAFIPYTEA